MRIRVFPAMVGGFLSVSMIGQSAAQGVPRADHVVVLKKERTLELLSQVR